VLFVDRQRRVLSISERHIDVPYLHEQFRHDPARVRAFFAFCGDDPVSAQVPSGALAEELRLMTGELLPPRRVVEAGILAIAEGRIVVASALPDRISVYFDADEPATEWLDDGVRFASESVARNFLANHLSGPGESMAFQTAMQHPPGLQGAMTQAGARGIGTGQIAAMLVSQSIGLLPRDATRQVLRLVWLKRGAPSVADAGSPAAAPAATAGAAPPPPSPSVPMSSLPDPPAELSPQAQTLIEAAKSGVPFCEECARRAAEMANA
jgi:hypothetical protein